MVKNNKIVRDTMNFRLFWWQNHLASYMYPINFGPFPDLITRSHINSIVHKLYLCSINYFRIHNKVCHYIIIYVSHKPAWINIRPLQKHAWTPLPQESWMHSTSLHIWAINDITKSLGATRILAHLKQECAGWARKGTKWDHSQPVTCLGLTLWYQNRDARLHIADIMQ